MSTIFNSFPFMPDSEIEKNEADPDVSECARFYVPPVRENTENDWDYANIPLESFDREEEIERRMEEGGLKIREEEIERETEEGRPKTRGDCRDGERPCPFVSCRYHLYLVINPMTGSIKINFPDKNLEDLRETCALDVAEGGTLTLEEIGDLLNLTRERVRQIENMALMNMRRAIGEEKLAELLGLPVTQSSHSVPVRIKRTYDRRKYYRNTKDVQVREGEKAERVYTEKTSGKKEARAIEAAEDIRGIDFPEDIIAEW
jgi:hypothetical protein